MKSTTACQYPVGCFIASGEEGFAATVALYFSKDMASAAYEAWAGEPVEEMDEDVVEVLREVLNMVYGQAKTVVKDLAGIDLKPAVPTSLMDGELKEEYARLKPAIAIGFGSEKGSCQIEISVSSSGDGVKHDRVA